jgi:hypothetical protein
MSEEITAARQASYYRIKKPPKEFIHSQTTGKETEIAYLVLLENH